MKKVIFVTGGAGFIGSNFLNYMVPKYKDIHFVNLDKLTYASSLSFLRPIENLENYSFVRVDISDVSALNEVFIKFKPEGVVHFAAESHVDNSIESPEAFIFSNIVGTFNLLESSRKLWLNNRSIVKPEYKDSRFLHISTDEVFGSAKNAEVFTESTAYAPNSPYSATKASADHLARSYFKTYGLNLVTTNCSNNFGPHQHKEKFIPKIIQKIISGDKVPVYGSGKNIRDWLYVEDHCKALEKVFFEGQSGELYCIGARNEKNNLEIIDLIYNILKSKRSIEKNKEELIDFTEDRLGHDFRYSINPAKIETELNWRPETDFERGLEKTVDWYLAQFNR